ncbi:MAG: Guanine nucleotide-binding protein-like 3 [Marteilia pararefringens]
MKSHKRESKRLSIHKKNKIAKKVKDQKIKVKKANKSKPKRQDNRHIMMNMIPNSAPFKIDLLNDLERQEKLKTDPESLLLPPSAEEVEAKNEINSMLYKNGMKKDYIVHNDLKYEVIGEVLPDRSKFNSELSQRYSNVLKNILNESNVVIEILDARNPSAFRCLQLEESVKSMPGKQLILLLNRCDKVPKEVLVSWLNLLRKDNVVIPFKSNEAFKPKSSGGKKISSVISQNHSNFSPSSNLSCELLFEYLKSFQKEISADGNLQPLNIGVIGRMNSGKNSFISTVRNFESYRSSYGTSKSAMENIEIRPKIFLNCKSGLVHSTVQTQLQSVLQNAIKISDLKTPEEYAEKIYDFLDKDMLRYHYSLPEFDSFEKFIVLYCMSKNCIAKQGLANKHAGMYKFVREWFEGQIPFYSFPNEQNASTEGFHKTEVKLIATACSSMPINSKAVVERSSPLTEVFENAIDV